MEKNVERYLEKRAENIKEEWENNIKERIKKLSPIEALFYIEFIYWMEDENNVPSGWKHFFIRPQYEITTLNDKKYRVDFLVQHTNNPINPLRTEAIIIELDSFLWHGSDAEQFTKEKERERELQKDDWKIMRFSGREIVRNVEKCVEQVIEYFTE